MKKLYLILILSLTLLACQQEEILPTDKVQENKGVVAEIPYYSLPLNILNLLEVKSKSQSKISENSNSPFGSPRTDIPAKRNVSKQGYISHTIALKKQGVSENDIYFDNIVISEQSNRKETIRILRYHPDALWYLSPTRHNDLYSGSITFYSSQGQQLGKIRLVNGEEIKDKQQQKKMTTTCYYEETGFWCYGGNYDTPASCTYNFKETCSSTYSEDESPGGGGSLGGEPTGSESTGTEPAENGSRGGSITTSPISDEKEETEYVDLEEEYVLTVERDSSFTKIDKINCTYEQLKKAGSLEKILQDFFGEDAIFNITYSVIQDLECNGKSTVTGCATQMDDYNYQAKFDKDYVLNEKTPTIFLAQSIIHESIHANLYAAVVKHNKGFVPADTSFEALYQNYCNIKGWQHEMMTADYYTEIMEKAIRAVHPYLKDDPKFLNLYDDSGWDRFYKYISNRGLKDTEAGKDYFADTENASLYKVDAETLSTKQPVCDEPRDDLLQEQN